MLHGIAKRKEKKRKFRSQISSITSPQKLKRKSLFYK